MNIKLSLIAFAFVSAMALQIAGAATPWLRYESGTTTITYTFYQQCTKVGDGDTTCKDYTFACEKRQQGVDAGKAFGIITTVLGGLIAFPTVWRLFREDFITGGVRTIVLITAFALLIANTIQWIIPFAEYSVELCSVKLSDTPDTYKVGPQGPLFFVAFWLALTGTIFECLWGNEAAPTTSAPEDQKTAAPAPAATTA